MEILDPFAEPCTNCPLVTAFIGDLVPRGCAPINYCYGVAKAGTFFTGQSYQDPLTIANRPLWDQGAGKPPFGFVSNGVYGTGGMGSDKTGNLSQVFCLAAIGNSWRDFLFTTQLYMHALDLLNQDWRLYTMAHVALHDKTPIFDKDNTELLNWLDRAPCIGPYGQDEHYYEVLMFNAINQAHSGGYEKLTFAGLDYMLLYNLYYINYANELPPYTTNWLHFSYNSAVLTNSNISMTPASFDIPFSLPCSWCPPLTGNNAFPLQVRANNEITATNTIGADGNVEYKAGFEITLDPEFEVIEGAEFYAFIEPTFCLGSNYNKTGSDEGYGVYEYAVPMSENVKSTRPVQTEHYIEQQAPPSLTYNDTNKISNSDTEFLNVYPNPTQNGIFNIVISDRNSVISMVIVRNLLGKIVYSQESGTGREFQLDLSNSAKGVYLLFVKTQEQMYYRKIVNQ